MSLDVSAGHAHSDGPGYGTLRTYLTGFVLAAVLSILAFGLVFAGGFGEAQATAVVLLLIAISRIIVHMVYFLRVNASAEGGWTALSLIFTAVVVVLVLIGSIWVMYHIDINTMPMPGSEAGRGS
jgi:cytochrome o ubiquinol oxidase subunit IV